MGPAGDTCCLPRDPSSIFSQSAQSYSRVHLIGVVGVAVGTMFAALGVIMVVRRRYPTHTDKTAFEYAALEANPTANEKHVYGSH